MNRGGNYIADLYHYGKLGMKWGHHKPRTVGLLTPVLGSINKVHQLNNKNLKKQLEFADKISKPIGMNKKNQRINELNKYSDMKQFSEIKIAETIKQKEALINNSYTNGEKFIVNLLGSDAIKNNLDLNLDSYNTANNHYKTKTDKMLSEIGDMKISLLKVESRRQYTEHIGDTIRTTSWNGYKYIEK